MARYPAAARSPDARRRIDSTDAQVMLCVREKTFNLDVGMIEAGRRLFDAKTDTEAIQRALRKAIEDREAEDALDTLLEEGRFRTLYRRSTFSGNQG